MDIFGEISKAVVEGEFDKVKALTDKAVAQGLDPMEIIQKGLIHGMDIVGPRFKAGDMFVPEVLMSARSMHAGMDILKPLLTQGAMPAQGKIVIGTVKGDLHDIGKNLVGMMLEAAGFEVVNLGTDVAPEAFVDAAEDHGAKLIGMSGLLTTTIPAMKDTIEILKEDGIRENFKVMIGGAPVTQEFADQIGADGYAADAASAVDMARKLLK